MIYRRFGRTEIKMPLFSCGGMRYQHKWQDVPLDDVPADNQANLEATIRRFIELGINHIETAHSYGSSERQLGLILPSFPREQLIVQTKVEPCADPSEFIEKFNESLARLRLDYVDLLAIHGINNYELLWRSIRPGGCLAAARKLQADGLVRHVGFSTHGSLDIILDTIRHDGDGGFDYGKQGLRPNEHARTAAPEISPPWLTGGTSLFLSRRTGKAYQGRTAGGREAVG